MNNEELLKKIEALEREMASLKSNAFMSPQVADAIAQQATSSASGAYSGYFRINGKIVGYYDS